MAQKCNAVETLCWKTWILGLFVIQRGTPLLQACRAGTLINYREACLFDIDDNMLY